MKATSFILLQLILVASSLAQEYSIDTLNRFDAKGKKTGYWISFLDEYTNPTSKENAFYYSFSYYEAGKSLLKQEKSWKWKRKYPLAENTKFKGEKGNPVLLHGTVEWHMEKPKKKRRLKAVYEDGFLVYIDEVFCKKDTNCVNYNYTLQKIGNYPPGFLIGNSRGSYLNPGSKDFIFLEDGKLWRVEVYMRDSGFSDIPEPYASLNEINFYNALLDKIEIEPLAFDATFSGMARLDFSFNVFGELQAATIISSPHKEYSRAMISAVKEVKRETILNLTEAKDTTIRVEIFYYCAYDDLPPIKTLKARYRFCYHPAYHALKTPQPDNYTEAQKLYKKEKYAEAKEYITLAYRGEPRSSEILLLMGKIHLALKDTSAACKAFKKGAKLGCLDSAIYAREVCP